MEIKAGKYYTGLSEYGDQFWGAVFDSPLGLQVRYIQTKWHTGMSVKCEALEDTDWLDYVELKETTKEEFEKALDSVAQSVLDLKTAICFTYKE
jgi:hypothetical protein